MFEDNKIGFAIQSRLGSNRLPGKALLYYGGSTVLGFLIKSLLEYGVQKKVFVLPLQLLLSTMFWRYILIILAAGLFVVMRTMYLVGIRKLLQKLGLKILFD